MLGRCATSRGTFVWEGEMIVAARFFQRVLVNAVTLAGEVAGTWRGRRKPIKKGAAKRDGTACRLRESLRVSRRNAGVFSLCKRVDKQRVE